MPKYLMILKPMDTFFFGQEHKYRKRKKKFVADYYQVSAYFPQQTTMLGMLRYYLLQINGQLPIENTVKTLLLIGKESFSHSQNDLKFGVIQKLSPVFILKGENKYIPQPLEVLLDKEGKVKNITHEKLSVKSNLPNNADNQIFYFKDYKYKEGLSNFLVNIADPEKYIPYDYEVDKENSEGIFVAEERTGITKGKDGETEENAFYKQLVYKLKGAAFGCIVELADGYIEDGHAGFVPMGAEKSLFKISFQKVEFDLEDELKLEDHNAPKLVLLSDAYIPDGVELTHRFSISKSKAFRFLESKMGDKVQYGHFAFETEAGNNGIQRSKRFNLYKRGSVFYFGNAEQMAEMGEFLQKQSNFYKIGYNHFKEIKN